jgi:hypothetical protein
VDPLATFPTEVALGEPAAPGLAAYEKLQIKELIHDAWRRETLHRTRHPAELGFQPEGRILLFEQELPTRCEEWVAGLRVLTSDAAGREALLVQDQPLAGCELARPAGVDRRRGFRIEAAHPDWRNRCEVTVRGVARDFFDSEPPLGFIDSFGSRIRLLPGGGHQGRVFRLDPGRPRLRIATAVYHPGRSLVCRPERLTGVDSVDKLWEPPVEIDPDLLPLKVLSGGFLRLSVAGRNTGSGFYYGIPKIVYNA